MEVSIIVPVYNGEKNIEYTLKSLANQTFQNFEIIIVDDGSTDGTKEVVNRVKKSFDSVIYFFQDNKGVSSARNKGIELANGKYITFLDADDTLEINYIEEMYKSIKTKDYDYVFSGYNISTPKGTTQKRTRFMSNNMLNNYILGIIAPATMSWMIKRQYLISNKVRFLEGSSWGEDFEFFCEMLSFAGKGTFVAKYLSNYNREFHSNHLSMFKIENIDKDYDSIMRLLENKNISSSRKIRRSLINYRLQALIIFNLSNASKYGVPKEKIGFYYSKYRNHIKMISYTNGLRSLKVNIYKIKVMMFLRKW